MNKPKEMLSIRIPEELKTKLEEKALEEQRNVSNMVIKILTDYFIEIERAKKILGKN